ncbi:MULTISPECIES: TetR/AcrR family transcriptional regulator [unclassified Bradyrhizobium]|uniref:TetR/AcrR family transcriptional regulator n=1 Tax=unclassified Bradyrhizobium TaxID=2631580 RepID=UPI0028E3B188|nr:MULTISPECIES: TetR/AcrR family transcriptional regulator [unclassified Bradyrhizobium]
MVTSSSHAAPSPAVAGSARTERKHAQILASARTLFMAGGFDTTSVDAIARHAGVSKATVYGHFADKDALLLALVEADCRSMGEQLWIRDGRPIDLERDLRQIARRFLAMFLDGRGLAMHRLVMSCASRYPAIAEAFMTAGPDRCEVEVAAFLRAAEAQGLIDVPNARLAATQFLTLIQGRLPLTWALSMKAPSAAVYRAQIEGGIKVFIAAYGRTGAGPKRRTGAVSTSAARRPLGTAARRP